MNPAECESVFSPVTFQVVVLTHNEPPHLIKKCLQSIRKAVDEFHHSIPGSHADILVVDDSRPELFSMWEKEAKQLQVNILNFKGNVAEKRNAGWINAQAEVILYTDADCWVDPDWITAHAKAYSKDPSVNGIIGLTEHETKNSRAYKAAEYAGFLVGYRFSTFLTKSLWGPCSNASYRREVLSKVSGFDPTFAISGEDVDISLRMFRYNGKLLNCIQEGKVHHDFSSFANGIYRRAWNWGSSEARLLISHPEHRTQAPPKFLYYVLLALIWVLVRLFISVNVGPLIGFLLVYFLLGPFIESRLKHSPWDIVLRTRLIYIIYQIRILQGLFRHKHPELLTSQMIYGDGQYRYEWSGAAYLQWEFLSFVVISWQLAHLW